MNNACPNCQQYRFPGWKRALAVWPFNIRCGNCKTAVRARVPRWQNVLAQILAQMVFWVVLIYAIVSGAPGLIIAGMLGAVAALIIALVPGFFSDLQVKK